MTTEIVTEVFQHPTSGQITRTYLITRDDQGVIVNKEFYEPKFSHPEPVYFKGTTVGAQTIDLATFPIPTQIFGETDIHVRHVDSAPPFNNGIGRFVVPWWRINGIPFIGTVVQLIPLQTPGSLSGITLPPLAVVGNTIVSRYTGKAGLTIDIVVEFTPTIYKF